MTPKQTYTTSSTTSINVLIKLQEEDNGSLPGTLLFNEISANRKRGLHTDLEIFTKSQQRRQKVSSSLAHQAMLARVSPMLSSLFKGGATSRDQFGPSQISLVLDTNVSWLAVEAVLDLIYSGKQPKHDVSTNDIDEVLKLLGIPALMTSHNPSKPLNTNLPTETLAPNVSSTPSPTKHSKKNSDLGGNKRGRGVLEPIKILDAHKNQPDRADSTTDTNQIVNKKIVNDKHRREVHSEGVNDESEFEVDDVSDEDPEGTVKMNGEKRVGNSHSEDDGEAETLEVIGDSEEEDNESVMDEEEYQEHTAAAEKATIELKDEFRGNKDTINRKQEDPVVSSTTTLKCKTDNCGKTYAKDDIGSCESGEGFKGHILQCQHPVLQNQDLFQTMEGIESEDSSDELADDVPTVSTTTQPGMAVGQHSSKRPIQSSDRDRRAKKRSSLRMEDSPQPSSNQVPAVHHQPSPSNIQNNPASSTTAPSNLIQQLFQVGQSQQQQQPPKRPLPGNQSHQKMENISIKKEIQDEDKALICPHCLNNEGNEIKKFSSTMELFDHTEKIRECSGAFILDQDQWNGNNGGTRCALCRREVFSLLHYQHHLALHYLGPLRNRFDPEFQRIEGQSYAACIECGLQMKSAGDHAIHKAVDHRRFLEWAPQVVKMHLVELGFGVKPKKHPGAQ